MGETLDRHPRTAPGAHRAAQGCTAGCGQPTHDPAILLCKPCTRNLTTALHDTTWLDQELDITLSRQGVTGENNHNRRSAETPLPVHLGALQARSALTATLVRWVKTINHTHPRPLPQQEHPWAPVKPANAARWLLAQHREHNALAKHPDAGTMHREIVDAVQKAVRTIDTPAQKAFVGVCGDTNNENGAPCPAALYAAHGAHSAACDTCHARHDVATKRHQVRELVEDRLATTTEICRALAWVGEHITPKLVNYWARHGRIVERGRVPIRGKDRPLYRIGDVLSVAMETKK